MATILSLKRRIQAAQNVSKTTRAMQMIAASKLKKAQNAAISSRPYVDKLTSISQNIKSKLGEDLLHPYLREEKSETGKTLLLAFSPDKGLCGGLITNLIRKLFEYNSKDYVIVTVGKKIENYVAYVKKELVASFPFGNTLPTFDMVYPIAKIINDYYLSGKVDRVEVLSTQFESIFRQIPKTTTLLPIALPKEITFTPFQLFEPAMSEILPDLLKRYLETKIYQELLESYVSEQGARMIAMQNATNNAKDITQDLRLEYNKTRQAKITSEILDISSASIFNTYE